MQYNLIQIKYKAVIEGTTKIEFDRVGDGIDTTTRWKVGKIKIYNASADGLFRVRVQQIELTNSRVMAGTSRYIGKQNLLEVTFDQEVYIEELRSIEIVPR